MKPNHNINLRFSSFAALFILCQRYKMKPNHNLFRCAKFLTSVVYTMSKIQNETKSQLNIYISFHESRCLYYVKDTK